MKRHYYYDRDERWFEKIKKRVHTERRVGLCSLDFGLNVVRFACEKRRQESGVI